MVQLESFQDVHAEQGKSWRVMRQRDNNVDAGKAKRSDIDLVAGRSCDSTDSVGCLRFSSYAGANPCVTRNRWADNGICCPCIDQENHRIAVQETCRVKMTIGRFANRIPAILASQGRFSKNRVAGSPLKLIALVLDAIEYRVRDRLLSKSLKRDEKQRDGNYKIWLYAF